MVLDEKAARIVLQQLEAQEAHLIHKLAETRDALKGIRLVLKPGLFLSELANSNEPTRHQEPQTATPAKTKKTSAPRKKRGGGRIRNAVRTAINEQLKPFTGTEIRAFLDTRDPEISRQITNKRLSQELYSARLDGVIEFHTSTAPGARKVYETVKT